MIFTDERRRRGAVLVTPAIQMTAAASGSNGIIVADDDDIDFGTGDFFLHWEGSLPDWTPGATNYLVFKRASSTSYYTLLVNSTNNIRVSAQNGAPFIFQATGSSLSGLVDGSIHKITAVIVRETPSTNGSITFYMDGYIFGSAASISSATPPTVNNSGPLYVSGGNVERTASNTISCIVGNFAPTAAEVLDLCTNGVPESWKWGTQTALYTSDFSVNANGFVSLDGGAVTVTGNIDGIDGEDNWCRVSRVSGTGDLRASRPAMWTQNYYYSVTVKIRNETGATADFGVVGLGSTPVSIANNTTAVFTFKGRRIISATNLIIGRVAADNSTTTSGGTGVFYFKELSQFRTGATMALLPDTIPTSSATTWSDTSGNTGGGTLPAAGATKVTIRK